jgi:hypothetical protein
LQEQLTEEKQKVVELEAQPAGHADDDELAQQMENSRQEIQALNKVFHRIRILIVENQRR